MKKYKVVVGRKNLIPYDTYVFARNEEEAQQKAKYDIATNSTWALMQLPSFSISERLKELSVLSVEVVK